MKTIYKYKLDVTDEQIVDLPAGAEILSVQDQLGDLCLWALVDVKWNDGELEAINEEKSRKIWIFGTGNPIEVNTERCVFLGSVQQGRFVWHVFEKLTEAYS